MKGFKISAPDPNFKSFHGGLDGGEVLGGWMEGERLDGALGWRGGMGTGWE